MPDLHGAVLWRDICERYAVLRGRLLFVTGDTLSPAQRERAGLRRRDLVAGGFERLTHHTGKLRLVVNDEHAALVHRAVTPDRGRNQRRRAFMPDRAGREEGGGAADRPRRPSAEQLVGLLLLLSAVRRSMR